MMPAALSITRHGGDAREVEAERLLLRLMREYDLGRWLFTRQIMIRSQVRPHSHPVLTLNTRQLGDEDGFLGTFLHEQFHWAAEAKRDLVERAINELRPLFPEAPVGPPQGARDEFSTYLHLIICTLELDALRMLVGEARARSVIEKRGYYTWTYRQALYDARALRSLLARHGLALGDLGSPSANAGQNTPRA